MNPYLISLLAGVLAGAIYGLLRVRSPAPPLIALVGLLGMVIGAQLVPLGKQIFASAAASVEKAEVAHLATGEKHFLSAVTMTLNSSDRVPSN